MSVRLERSLRPFSFDERACSMRHEEQEEQEAEKLVKSNGNLPNGDPIRIVRETLSREVERKLGIGE